VGPYTRAVAESVSITTPVLVHGLDSGDVLVQSLVDPALAVVAPTATDARLELELHLAEYLPTLPPHAWARFASAGVPELRKVSAKLPRADLPERLQPFTPVELSCVAIAASVGSLDRWVLLPALQLTCFVRGAEQLEDVVAAEVVRVVLARELGPSDYLRLLPGPAITVEQLTFTVGREESGTFRARTQQVQRREAHELLASVGRKLPLGSARARPLLERSAELRLLSGLLESAERQSMLVVGEEGAGKSALLATWLDQKRDNLPSIYATSGAELMAGMSGLGEWQERLGRVLDAAQLLDAILYIEDFSELTLERRGDMAGYLRTAIEQRRVRVLGELATRLVDESERRQPGLLAAMVRVVVPALTAANTRAVLDAHELYHRKTATRASLAPEALRALEDVASRYLPYEALPGAVLRLYDEVRGLDHVRTQSESKPLSAEDIYSWFSARSGVPLFLLREDVPLRAAELRSKLDQYLVGQDEAKRLVIDTLCIVKTRLAPLGKPLASFLFVGPTGVGKTELARSLATILFADPQRLVRFDMSEYADGDAAARLIRGRDSEEGQLTRKVREQPFCVVLLDEIEKAHPAVFDLLLQLLGEARLSDARGRTAFFHNTIVIMTSNLGTGQRAASGFGADESVDRDYRAAIREHFRPELVNRIDRVIAFTSLSRAQILPVVELLLAQVARRRGLAEAGATLQVSKSAVAQLAERGFSAAYGARGMRRHVEHTLTSPLARLCSEHAATLHGTTLHVDVAPYEGPGHVLARLQTTLHLTLVQPPNSAQKRTTTPEQELSERRRTLASRLRLDRVASLESEAQTLIADLAQAERRKTPMAVQTRLRTRHHQLSSILDELQRAYREVCALEDLSFAAALGNEQPPSFSAELAALGKRFDAALLTALVVDETEAHELTLLVQELDTRRGLDVWLVGLLDAADHNELRITVHPDAGDKDRWTSAVTDRAGILAETRDFRNVLVHIRGRYAAIRLGLEAGLIHYRSGEERDAMLLVSIISRSVQLTEREYLDPALKPQIPERFDALRRMKASRLFDLTSGLLLIDGAHGMPRFRPREHFARLDELVLAHLLLFEEDASLDRDKALSGPLVRKVFA
jgi:ATP-dependent Clp protease ATP-binding subunit ClpC